MELTTEQIEQIYKEVDEWRAYLIVTYGNKAFRRGQYPYSMDDTIVDWATRKVLKDQS